MADSDAPRWVSLTSFAIGNSNHNRLWLSIDEDYTYREQSKTLGIHRYAAHGGLVVYGKASGEATAFHSTLSFGAVRYTFFARMAWIERKELRFLHRDFYQFCCESIESYKKNPISSVDRLRLGL